MTPMQRSARRYADAYREREQRRRARATERRVELRAHARALSHLLRERFGAHTVGLFGSLARDTWDEGSDVDLYVDRIRRGRYIDALDLAWEMLGVPVDLVEYELAPFSLRECIDLDGRVLADG